MSGSKVVGRRVPSYRLHKGSGQAVVLLDGRAFYLGKWGSPASRREYARLIAEWSAAGFRVPQRSVVLTIEVLAADFVQYAVGYYGEGSSEFRKIRDSLRYLVRLYGPETAEAFGPLQFRAVRQAMVEVGLARVTINGLTSRLVRMFKWAAGDGRIGPAVWQGLRAVGGLRRGRSAAREGEPVRAVRRPDVAAVEPFVRPVVWAMIEVQWLTGMRSGELVSMRGADLEVGGEVWLYRPRRHKTEGIGSVRVVDLGPRAQAAIRPYLVGDGEAFLFMTDQGTSYRVDSYRRAIRRACDLAFPADPPLGRRADETDRARVARLDEVQRAELAAWQRSRRWFPHQLRHSAATRLARDYGIEAARAVLGHKSLVTTELYAEVDRRAVRRIVRDTG